MEIIDPVPEPIPVRLYEFIGMNGVVIQSHAINPSDGDTVKFNKAQQCWEVRYKKTGEEVNVYKQAVAVLRTLYGLMPVSSVAPDKPDTQESGSSKLAVIQDA